MDNTVLLPIMGEVDVDAIYRNPRITLAKRSRRGPRPIHGSGPMKDVCVVMDAESIEHARKLGDGNLSKGVREALRLARRTT